ncbi:MAG: zinc ribbon domain-containing protein [Deltaproteobacteria bacterium]|nr:zinc ribbon domain-containing protein [Deltaproteobacteria bacterium]MBW1922456.1 zinc ribbon domain-containing protein [Deltaproteobacteria bacterium]MBW1948359.1 zinc ribbon domain-containing protein [Deltaproteobacteria bacterium]MBW2006642.1 zinc ribbon domain-containing protein [Deltaproteobacteria bacterium]MBW2102000.1 zinc ribbon domain-containing protein [Deltaproteobacteria bacterium]
MPIYEFKCLECGEIIEKLFLNPEDPVELKCPKCSSESFERVLSTTSYAMGAGPGGNQPKLTTKSCGSSSQCMTLEIPGPAK